MPRRVPRLTTSILNIWLESTPDDPFRLDPIEDGYIVLANKPADWSARVLTVTPRPLTAEELQEVERIIDAYIFERAFEVSRIPYRGRDSKVSAPYGAPTEGFLDRLEHIGKLLRDLETTTEVVPSVDHAVWEEICAEDLNFDHVMTTIKELHERAQRVWRENATRYKAAELAAPAFARLVRLSANFFRTHGWPVTAAKGSRARNPRPSLFVGVIWAMMEAVPKPIRQHHQSPAALAKAIAPLIKRDGVNDVNASVSRAN